MFHSCGVMLAGTRSTSKSLSVILSTGRLTRNEAIHLPSAESPHMPDDHNASLPYTERVDKPACQTMSSQALDEEVQPWPAAES